VEEVAGRLFVAMEHIGPDAQGRVSLADHLEGAHAPLDSKQTVKWAIEFCLGMEHAGARGIECHRDIKPANILITQDGTLKIGDFGLAAAAEVAWVGSSGRDGSLVTGGPEAGFGFSLIQTEGKMRCGTPGYIAPEGYRFEGGDIRSDIYSFGLVLWQVAAGSRLPPWTVPWRGDMENYLRGIYEQQMVANVPHTEGPLGSVIKRCLRPRPSERYGSFQELRATLEPIWNSITGRDFESPAKEQQTRAFWNNKGNALHALGRYEEAIICLDRALAIDPLSAPAWSNKGNAFRALGRHAEAIACYDKALTISPQSAIPWDNKGVVLDTLGRGEEALRCYDRALLIDPRFTSTWNNKGVALNLLGRHIEAIACFEKALEIDPRHANAWYVKALTEDRVGQSGAALKSYRRFVELAPPQDVRGIARARQRVQELESKGV